MQDCPRCGLPLEPRWSQPGCVCPTYEPVAPISPLSPAFSDGDIPDADVKTMKDAWARFESNVERVGGERAVEVIDEMLEDNLARTRAVLSERERHVREMAENEFVYERRTGKKPDQVPVDRAGLERGYDKFVAERRAEKAAKERAAHAEESSAATPSGMTLREEARAERAKQAAIIYEMRHHGLPPIQRERPAPRPKPTPLRRRRGQ